MSDDDSRPGSEPLPEQQSVASKSEASEPAEERRIENPLLAYTVGGTPTTASERLYEQRFQDGEARRREDDQYKALAQLPVEQGGAKQYSHRLTRNPEIPQAYLLLKYVNRHGTRVPPGECLADVLITDWENPNDLTLQIMCPRCWTSGVKHAQDCQLRIRMSNRRWYLDAGKGEKEFLFNDGSGPKRYRSAGVVTESEVFTCSDCAWRGRIVNNTIRTE